MSLLAHSTYAAPGFEAQKKNEAKQAQLEIKEARQLKEKYGFTWTEALRLARERLEDQHILKLGQYYRPYDDLP